MAEQAKAVAEQARAVAEQQDKLEPLTMLEKYLRGKDPEYLSFLASNLAKAPATETLATSLPQQNPTSNPSPPAS